MLLEGFMWRHHPRVAKIRGLIADELGTLRLVRIAYTYDLGANYAEYPAARARDIRLSPELGGGALGDIGSYTVSGLRVYSGGRPRLVSSELLSEENGVDTRFAGQIVFDNGVVGQFFTAMDIPGGALLDLQGDGGRLRMLNAFRTAPEWGGSSFEVASANGERRIETMEFVDQFELEVAHVAAVLLDGEAPLIPSADSIENADTLDAIRRAWTGRRVEMPPSEAERSGRS
jgi:predicted dehydrogenase